MGFFEKAKTGLTRTKENIGYSFGQFFAEELDDDFYDELEEALIPGDMGVDTTIKAVKELCRRVGTEKIEDVEGVRTCLRQVLTDMLQAGEPALKLDTTLSVTLFAGVDGVGKTIAIGKLSVRIGGGGHRVLMVTAGTFRAVVAGQFRIWSERSGVGLVHQHEGADPAAVVSDTLTATKARNVDVVLIGTAGQLHNKQNLTNELSKVSRVVDRELPGCDRETLLVLDATIGQNDLVQTKQFREVAGIIGVVLTKLDGSTKGGTVIAATQEPQVSTRFIDVGEGIDDLVPLETEKSVETLV